MDNLDHPMSFISLGSLSQAMASKMGWEREARLWKVIRLWKDILGDPIARMSYPSALLDKELVIACASELWKRELTFLLPEIQTRLLPSCPSLSGLSFTFRVVRPFSLPLKDKEDQGEIPEEILERIWSRAGEISAHLPEPMREKARRFVAYQLINGMGLRSSRRDGPSGNPPP